jgi:hypothetical protein
VVEVGDAGRNPQPAGDPTRDTAELIRARTCRTLVLFALVAATAACGAQRTSAPPPRPRPPKIPNAVAARLAGEADAVAAALARGDACAARQQAARLRADATSSIGRVPAALQEPLSSGVNALVAELPRCVVPAVPAATTTAESPPPPREHESHHEHPKDEKRPKHEHHGKHKDENGGGD